MCIPSVLFLDQVDYRGSKISYLEVLNELIYLKFTFPLSGAWPDQTFQNVGQQGGLGG